MVIFKHFYGPPFKHLNECISLMCLKKIIMSLNLDNYFFFIELFSKLKQKKTLSKGKRKLIADAKLFSEK